MDDYRIDSHKLTHHPQRVSQWMEADTWEKAKKVYPLYWEITTSAACNHRCTFCSVDAIGYPAILMDEAILTERLWEAHNSGVKSVMFAGTGEPLLHKAINDIVGVCARLGLDAAFTTNGVLLNKLRVVELCSWIKISLNAGSAKSYAAIHQTDEGDWNKVWNNIHSATKRKGKCAIGVQCVVLPENLNEMRDLAHYSREAGADYLVLKPYSQGTFSLVQRSVDYKEMHAYLQTVKDYDTDTFKVIYRADSMKQESEQHHYDKCRATPVFWVYSMANGDVFTCSAHLMNPKFCIGNLNTQSFQEIWEGEKRRENWEMMKSFDIKECRKNCRMDKSNRYLSELSLGIPHQNFV
jgi:radical SAM protein with 4Fe4S-binding SPASM domain